MLVLPDQFDFDEFQEVDSSTIAAVGTKNDWLIIFFNKGTSYRYHGCAIYFSALSMSDSVGKAFHSQIKNQSFEKLDAGDWPPDEEW